MPRCATGPFVGLRHELRFASQPYALSGRRITRSRHAAIISLRHSPFSESPLRARKTIAVIDTRHQVIAPMHAAEATSLTTRRPRYHHLQLHLLRSASRTHRRFDFAYQAAIVDSAAVATFSLIIIDAPATFIPDRADAEVITLSTCEIQLTPCQLCRDCVTGAGRFKPRGPRQMLDTCYYSCREYADTHESAILLARLPSPRRVFLFYSPSPSTTSAPPMPTAPRSSSTPSI
jgi:hypothetical protein